MANQVFTEVIVILASFFGVGIPICGYLYFLSNKNGKGERMLRCVCRACGVRRQGERHPGQNTNRELIGTQGRPLAAHAQQGGRSPGEQPSGQALSRGQGGVRGQQQPRSAPPAGLPSGERLAGQNAGRGTGGICSQQRPGSAPPAGGRLGLRYLGQPATRGTLGKRGLPQPADTRLGAGQSAERRPEQRKGTESVANRGQRLPAAGPATGNPRSGQVTSKTPNVIPGQQQKAAGRPAAAQPKVRPQGGPAPRVRAATKVGEGSGVNAGTNTSTRITSRFSEQQLLQNYQEADRIEEVAELNFRHAEWFLNMLRETQPRPGQEIVLDSAIHNLHNAHGHLVEARRQGAELRGEGQQFQHA